MGTRSIVTSQPVLACDMCGRRLLRGEHPEAFVAGGERRTVCELCAPRAAYEGWVREGDIDESLMLRPSRRGRGGSWLGRLRQLREPARSSAPRHEPDLSDEALEGLVGGDEREPPRAADRAYSDPVYAGPAHADPVYTGRAGAPDESQLQQGGSQLQWALDVFNAGEHPRRMGGVARSLGTPSVTVRPVEGAPARFTIVVAWELCWYRYEVNLDDEPSGAQLLEKGMELSELPGEDRTPNALADERGALTLADEGVESPGS